MICIVGQNELCRDKGEGAEYSSISTTATNWPGICTSQRKVENTKKQNSIVEMHSHLKF